MRNEIRRRTNDKKKNEEKNGGDRSGIKYSLPLPLPVIFGIAPIKKNKISICEFIWDSGNISYCI